MAQDYLKYKTVTPNECNLDGRCGHNMIPKWCALCNPVVAKRMKQKKTPDRRQLTSRFILVITDIQTGVEYARFWDDQLDEAKALRDEMNEVDGCEAVRVDIIQNPKHPDYEDTKEL